MVMKMESYFGFLTRVCKHLDRNYERVCVAANLWLERRLLSTQGVGIQGYGARADTVPKYHTLVHEKINY
jgi:hypothetical protein